MNTIHWTASPAPDGGHDRGQHRRERDRAEEEAERGDLPHREHPAAIIHQTQSSICCRSYPRPRRGRGNELGARLESRTQLAARRRPDSARRPRRSRSVGRPCAAAISQASS